MSSQSLGLSGKPSSDLHHQVVDCSKRFLSVDSVDRESIRAIFNFIARVNFFFFNVVADATKLTSATFFSGTKKKN